MKRAIKKPATPEALVVINPCSKCGKPISEIHWRWCGIKSGAYTRMIRPRILFGHTDYICTGCLSIVLKPEHGCPRCDGAEVKRKEAAASFFAERAERKKQEKLEAQLLADEAADLI